MYFSPYNGCMKLISALKHYTNLDIFNIGLQLKNKNEMKNA